MFTHFDWGTTCGVIIAALLLIMPMLDRAGQRSQLRQLRENRWEQ